jgi:hypothetical protein
MATPGGAATRSGAYLANKLGLEVRAAVRPAQDDETEAGRDTMRTLASPLSACPRRA